MMETRAFPSEHGRPAPAEHEGESKRVVHQREESDREAGERDDGEHGQENVHPPNPQSASAASRTSGAQAMFAPNRALISRTAGLPSCPSAYIHVQRADKAQAPCRAQGKRSTSGRRRADLGRVPDDSFLEPGLLEHHHQVARPPMPREEEVGIVVGPGKELLQDEAVVQRRHGRPVLGYRTVTPRPPRPARGLLRHGHPRVLSTSAGRLHLGGQTETRDRHAERRRGGRQVRYLSSASSRHSRADHRRHRRNRAPLPGDDGQLLRDRGDEQLDLLPIGTSEPARPGSRDASASGTWENVDPRAPRTFPRIHAHHGVAPRKEHRRDGSAGGPADTSDEDPRHDGYPMREKLARTTSNASA